MGNMFIALKRTGTCGGGGGIVIWNCWGDIIYCVKIAEIVGEFF